jgi:hypothetical protein
MDQEIYNKYKSLFIITVITVQTGMARACCENGW